MEIAQICVNLFRFFEAIAAIGSFAFGQVLRLDGLAGVEPIF
jgi:hypothetical protein